MMIKEAAIFTAMAAFVVSGNSGCSARSGTPHSETRVGHGDGLFPAETIKDLVSYAYHVVEVAVLGEDQIPPPQRVFTRGEGYVGRQVAVQVNDVIWSAPGAPNIPAETRMVVSGWILKNEQLSPFSMVQSPRLEVGGRYLMPVVELPRPVVGFQLPERTTRPESPTPVPTEMQWSPLSTDAVFAVPGDQVAMRDVESRGNSALARELSKLDRAALKLRLEEATIDPDVKKHIALPPHERIRAVQAARQ